MILENVLLKKLYCFTSKTRFVFSIKKFFKTFFRYFWTFFKILCIFKVTLSFICRNMSFQGYLNTKFDFAQFLFHRRGYFEWIKSIFIFFCKYTNTTVSSPCFSSNATILNNKYLSQHFCVLLFDTQMITNSIFRLKLSFSPSKRTNAFFLNWP